MINQDMENANDQENTVFNGFEQYSEQKINHTRYQVHIDQSYAQTGYINSNLDPMQPRASIMSIRSTSKLEELRGKCFERLAQ